MSKTLLPLSSFDTNSGVTEDALDFNAISPSLVLTSGDYAIKDMSLFDNQGFTFYMKETYGTSKYRILIGTDVAGAGHCLDFVSSGTSDVFTLGTTTAFNDALATTIESVELNQTYLFTSDSNFRKVTIKIINGDIFVYLDGYGLLCSAINQTLTGTHFGIAGLDTASDVHISDLTNYENQIYWGNINLNGAPDENGYARMYNRVTHELEYESKADADGNYSILIEDDPANGNKYYIIGFIDGVTAIQPRGVSNITL